MQSFDHDVNIEERMAVISSNGSHYSPIINPPQYIFLDNDTLYIDKLQVNYCVRNKKILDKNKERKFSLTG